MQKRFQRNREDFLCEVCGESVSGDGYTNHCPKCLWSRHVDINPGDRANSCRGLMEPIGVEGRDPYRIVHRCVACGTTKRNKQEPNDDFEALIELSRNSADRFSKGE
ncbi:MAG: RNHCP domain-containing protein [Bdellovibrionales bacterium]|nr:RNHCP domain-containing protein [Bdellovibrionales bacterium]